jgi:hypothetical protein
MLSNQADELREKADMLDGLEGMDNLVPMLREAADTIESLSDKLQGVMGTRYCELFGTPERAARTLIDCNAFKQCVDCPVCHDERGETCEIPGDCAFVMRDYDALLDWLEGGAE